MWNYRLIRDKERVLHVHEVFYTEEWGIWWYTEPLTLSGSAKKDILGDLEYMIKDIARHPILNEETMRKNLVKPDWLEEGEFVDLDGEFFERKLDKSTKTI